MPSGLAPLLAAGALQAAAAAGCGPDQRAAVLAPARGGDDAIALRCSLRLRPGEIVTKRLVLAGPASSGVSIDCEGGQVGAAPGHPGPGRYTIEIRSLKDGEGRWERPRGITVRNCRIEGPIRIWGMGENGQAEDVKLSSRSLGHTARAQAAAPTGITIEGSELVAAGRTPLYLGPGVTAVTLRDSRVIGSTGSIAVYLDAESARNRIEGNTFDIETGREVIAVDGSAENVITRNSFRIAWRGGVYLYRNCGEGGTVRHQTPSRNTVTDNRFRYGFPVHQGAVVVGSREGWRLYCGDDAGYPFGSSADDGDHATDNVVTGNIVE